MSPTTVHRQEWRRKLPHLQDGSRTLYVSMATRARWVLPPEARSLVLSHIRHEHKERIFLYAAVVMPEHVHTLFAPLCNDAGIPFGLAEIMHGMRGPSAHSVNKLLHRRGALWEEEYFDRVLRVGEFEETLDYICTNPVRRGLVEREEDYPWLWVALAY